MQKKLKNKLFLNTLFINSFIIKMTKILYSDEYGYHYDKIRPYVEKMNVSYDGTTYYLECDKQFNDSNIVGVFYGYPGNFNSDGNLVIGLSVADGLIYFNKFDEIVVFKVSNNSYEEYNLIIKSQNNLLQSNNNNNNILFPQCTNVFCYINLESKLTYINDDKLNVGLFKGITGIYKLSDNNDNDDNNDINNDNNDNNDNNNRKYDRIYGDDYLNGTIILFGPYKFKYIIKNKIISVYQYTYDKIYEMIEFIHHYK